MNESPQDMTEQAPAAGEPLQTRSHRRTGMWLIVLSQIVVLVVIVGGVVRLTGSGLSIPDWPLINGSLLPPTSDEGWLAVYQSYHSEIEGMTVHELVETEQPGIVPIGRFKRMFAIEYFHRTLAAVVGLIFLWIYIRVLRDRGMRSRYGPVLTFALVLLFGQALLGGAVVKTELHAALVGIHLGIAYLFFSLLFWTGMRLLNPPESAGAEGNRALGPLAAAALAMVYLQVLSGGMVAGTEAGHYLNTWPLMGDYLVPPPNLLWSGSYPGLSNLVHNKVLWQFFHRWWAFAAAAAVFVLVFKSMRYHVSERGRMALRLLAAVIVFQIILGIFTLLLKVPPVLGVVHLSVAILVFTLLLLITYETRNHAVERI